MSSRAAALHPSCRVGAHYGWPSLPLVTQSHVAHYRGTWTHAIVGRSWCTLRKTFIKFMESRAQRGYIDELLPIYAEGAAALHNAVVT